jgi:hypothetical protein
VNHHILFFLKQEMWKYELIGICQPTSLSAYREYRPQAELHSTSSINECGFRPLRVQCTYYFSQRILTAIAFLEFREFLLA